MAALRGLATCLCLALTACGGGMHGSASEREAAEGATASDGASTSRDPQGAGAAEIVCPATFDGARALGVDCAVGAHRACEYPEGRCGCEIHYRCSGVPPGPGEPNAWRVWECRAPEPEVRPDGCPGPEPADGDPCDGRASFCTYGECAFTPYRCVEGRWQRGTPSAPPSAPP